MYCAKQKNKRSGFLVFTVVFLSLILAVLTVGTVYAKYVYVTTGKNILAAKEFYFSSNLLTETGSSFKLNADTTTVSFTLRNSFDELRVSEVPIECDVSVTTQYGTTFHSVSFSDGTTLAPNAKNETVVTLSGLTKGEVYTVTATGSGGYRQTLQATFSVSPNENYVYYHLDTANPAYALLTVWTQNVSGSLNISVPAGLIPDNTDPLLRTVYNLDGTEYAAFSVADAESFATPYSSRTYRFFRTDKELTDFTVILENGSTTYTASKKTAIP